MEPESGHDLALVTVFEATDSFGLSLAKAALEEAGIDFVAEEEDPPNLPGINGTAGIGMTPIWKAHGRLLVMPEFQAEARAILEPLNEPEQS